MDSITDAFFSFRNGKIQDAKLRESIKKTRIDKHAAFFIPKKKWLTLVYLKGWNEFFYSILWKQLSPESTQILSIV